MQQHRHVTLCSLIAPRGAITTLIPSELLGVTLIRDVGAENLEKYRS